MKKKPRSKKSNILSKHEIINSLFAGSVISIAAISVYIYSLNKGLGALDARGITFTTLILSNLFLIFIKRGKKNKGESKKHFTILTFGTFALLACVLYIPFFRDLFLFNFLHIHDLLPCLIISLGAGGIIFLIEQRSLSKRFSV